MLSIYPFWSLYVHTCFVSSLFSPTWSYTSGRSCPSVSPRARPPQQIRFIGSFLGDTTRSGFTGVRVPALRDFRPLPSPSVPRLPPVDAVSRGHVALRKGTVTLGRHPVRAGRCRLTLGARRVHSERAPDGVAAVAIGLLPLLQGRALLLASTCWLKSSVR